MANVSVVLFVNKPTKNYIRFDEQDTKHFFAGTVYLSKKAVADLGGPQAVVVTIAPLK